MTPTASFHPEILGDTGPQIWLGNCLDALRAADDGCVDHTISDPPYERHMHVSKAEKEHGHGRKIRQDGYADIEALDFDSIEAIRDEVARELVRVTKGWLLVFCTPEGVAPWRDAIEAAGARYKRACVWVKPDAAPQFNGQGPAMGAESFVAAWCGSGFSRWNGGGKRGVYTHCVNPPERDGRHPTEKPLSLMRELVRDFTNAGDLILDPFMGGGSTGVAALIEGRRFVGTELKPKYYAVARQRLQWQLEQAGPVVRMAQKAAMQPTDAGPLFENEGAK